MHWTQEDVERFADGETSASDEHLRTCVQCANAVIAASQVKRAVRLAMEVGPAPASLRRRITSPRHPSRWWLATAAVIALSVGGVLLVRDRRGSTLSELADMHVTLLASANPVDVLSTDRHTVKPWFEGRVPFAVPVPDLAHTPFRLIGGRVVYVESRQAAYLLIAKDAHRVSLFIFADAPTHPGPPPQTVSMLAWRSGGLAFVAVGDVPRADLATLRDAVTRSAPQR